MLKVTFVVIAILVQSSIFICPNAHASSDSAEARRPGRIGHVGNQAKALLASALIATGALHAGAEERVAASPERFNLAPFSLSVFPDSAELEASLPPLRWAKAGDSMPQVWSQNKKRWVTPDGKMKEKDASKANIQLMATAGTNQKITFFDKLQGLPHYRLDGQPRPGDLVYKVDLSRQEVTLYRYRLDANDPNLTIWAQLKHDALTSEAREQFTDFLNADDFEPRALPEPEKVATSQVSTGKSGHRTQTGRWRITDVERSHTSTLYNSPMPYFQRFGGEDFGMHIGSLPGYAASHGCVRLPPGMAAKFFGLTGKALHEGAWVWGVVAP